MAENENDQEKPVIKNNANGGGNDQAAQFTQEQLDAIIRDRLERAKDKTTSDLMAQLGIENIEQAKTTLEDAAKLKEAQMSELEKAQTQVTEAMAKAAQAKLDMETMQIKANEALLKAAIIAKASGFNDPMDAWMFVDKSKIEIGEDGSHTGIDEAIKLLVEHKPYLIKVETNGNAKSGTPARPTPKTIAERLLSQNEKPKTASELRQEIDTDF
jgi:hypothetical protein